uniref:Uncharacterized protein n=1 Tax=Sphingobacterium sp. (strain 21) TaxID=743722 RepID=F4C8V8_SPHS2
MKHQNDLELEYNRQIIERFKRIIVLTELEVDGFAEFVNVTYSHIQGIINGSRSLSQVLARKIGKKLEFDGSKIFNLNWQIPISIKNAKALALFKSHNKSNTHYFVNTKTDRSINAFIIERLLPTGYLKGDPKYLKQIRRYCKDEFGRDFTSDELSKGLKYAVKKGLLQTKKNPILLDSGKLGDRMVDVFFN